MSRRELYQRTKGCTIYGVSCFAVFAVLTLAIAAIWNTERPTPIWMIFAALLALDGIAALVLFLSYWKYWLDLFQKATVLFDGEVVSGGPIIGAPLERGWNWRLIEKGSDTPQQFYICPRQLEKQYHSTALIQDLCSGPVSFRSLKRSKYIVEIIRISKPEPDHRSKHAQKKVRRKAQYQ